MFAHLIKRLSSLVTDAWGANTFPVSKYNSRTFHLKFVDHTFPVFPMFSSDKRWWQLRAFSFHGRRTRESSVALPPKGRLRQLVTPLELFLESQANQSVCFPYHDFPFVLFSFFLCLFPYVLVYINSLMLLVCF